MVDFLLQVSSIVHRTMTEADEDKDSFIDFEEFKKVHMYIHELQILSFSFLRMNVHEELL